MRNKKLFFILLALSLAYTLPAHNKYWAPYDEGIITVASQRLLAGEIPYKDFFLIMYPPGQVYVLACLYKLFSFSLAVGRIYTVFVSVGISLLVFYMTHIITGRSGISIFSWFVALVSLVGRLGAAPAPIWPGVFLSLFAIFMFMRYLESLEYRHIFFAGMFTGIAILFRHDIGVFALASIFLSLFVKILYTKNSYREMILFPAVVLAMLAPCVLYFAFKSAIGDMVDSLLLFPFVHLKTAALPFPRPCLDPRMIFHGSLYFINANQYYIPILVYFFTGLYLIKAFFKKTLSGNDNLMLLAVLLFGILAFNQVRTRTDPAHLLTVMQPAVVLFGFMMAQKKQALFGRAFVILILALFVLLSVKNIDKYVKNSFRKVYKKDIIETQFDVGRVYIPKEEKAALLDTVDFIKKNTLPSERIYLGNMAHWKDDFGGSLILYFLVQRLPSAKYYELAPGLVTDPDVQSEIKDSLIRHNVKLLVLQDIDLAAATLEPAGVRILDDFIQQNYGLVKKFGKFNIFMRK